MTLGTIEEYFARLETLQYLLDWNVDEVSDEAIFEIFLVPVAVLPDKNKTNFTVNMINFYLARTQKVKVAYFS